MALFFHPSTESRDSFEEASYMITILSTTCSTVKAYFRDRTLETNYFFLFMNHMNNNKRLTNNELVNRFDMIPKNLSIRLYKEKGEVLLKGLQKVLLGTAENRNQAHNIVNECWDIVKSSGDQKAALDFIKYIWPRHKPPKLTLSAMVMDIQSTFPARDAKVLISWIFENVLKVCETIYQAPEDLQAVKTGTLGDAFPAFVEFVIQQALLSDDLTRVVKYMTMLVHFQIQGVPHVLYLLPRKALALAAKEKRFPVKDFLKYIQFKETFQLEIAAEEYSFVLDTVLKNGSLSKQDVRTLLGKAFETKRVTNGIANKMANILVRNNLGNNLSIPGFVERRLEKSREFQRRVSELHRARKASELFKKARVRTIGPKNFRHVGVRTIGFKRTKARTIGTKKTKHAGVRTIGSNKSRVFLYRAYQQKPTGDGLIDCPLMYTYLSDSGYRHVSNFGPQYKYLYKYEVIQPLKLIDLNRGDMCRPEYMDFLKNSGLYNTAGTYKTDPQPTKEFQEFLIQRHGIMGQISVAHLDCHRKHSSLKNRRLQPSTIIKGSKRWRPNESKGVGVFTRSVEYNRRTRNAIQNKEYTKEVAGYPEVVLYSPERRKEFLRLVGYWEINEKGKGPWKPWNPRQPNLTSL